MRYKGDPKWLVARFAGRCAKCKAPINAGDQVFYYPTGKSAYCAAEACGKHEAALFQDMAAYEDKGL